MKRKSFFCWIVAAALLLPQGAVWAAAPGARTETRSNAAPAETSPPIRLAWDRVGAIA